MKSITISIEGMHCPSCAALLTEEFGKIHGVHHADISLKDSSGDIYYEGEEPSFDELAARARNLGYTVKKKAELSAGKAVRVNNLRSWALGALVAAGLVGAFALFQASVLVDSLYPRAGLSNLGLAIVIGVIASLSSCFAVVGSLVIAFGGLYGGSATTKPLFTAFRTNALFHAGRLASFFFLGGVLGVVGGSLSLSGRTLSVVLIIFAVVMVLMGLSILGLGRVFRFRGLKMPRVLSRGLERLKNSKNPLAPLLLGGITFFLPCGFTQSMQVIALGSGSFLAGAMVLFLFALGTVPVLFAAGFSASWTHFKQVDFLRITAGILIIVFAGYTLVSATSLIDYKGDIFSDSSNAGESTTAGLVAPNGPDSVNNNAQPSPDKSLSAKPPLTPADVNKEQPVSPQRVEMHVTYRGFEPAVLKVKAGVPVRWVIYGDQVTGCTSRIIIPSYSVSTSIQSGQNVVVFTPSKTGRVPFSCWMGMVRGVFVVE